MIHVIEDDFLMFKRHHDSYTIVAAPAGSISDRRSLRFQAFGSFFAIHTLETNRGPLHTSFALPLAMLLSPSEFICLPVSYIRIFDAEAAQQLEPWVRVGKDAHLPKGHHSSNTPEDTALLNMLYDLDIDVSDPRQFRHAQPITDQHPFHSRRLLMTTALPRRTMHTRCSSSVRSYLALPPLNCGAIRTSRPSKSVITSKSSTGIPIPAGSFR